MAASRSMSIEEELRVVDAALHAAACSHYSAHVFASRGASVSSAYVDSLEAGGRGVAHAAKELEASFAHVHNHLSELTAQYGRSRRALASQSAVAEVLEAPFLMHSAMRSGLYDEALDVYDYGINLACTFRPRAGQAGVAASMPVGSIASAQAAAHHAAAGVDVMRIVVDDIEETARELRATFLRQLSSGAKLASLVSTLGYLRRLHTQQVIGAKRMLAAPGPLSAATFTLAPEEERQLLLQLMDDFLTCRNNWHVAELDALPRHNIYQYIQRVVELQRLHWPDIVSQALAVHATLQPHAASPTPSHLPPTTPGASTRRPWLDVSTTTPTTPDAVSAQVHDALAFRARLHAWLLSRVDWFVMTWVSAVADMTDLTQLAVVWRQADFAARRAGRLGADYAHQLAPCVRQRVCAIVAQHLDAIVAAFAEALAAWQWTSKVGYDASSFSTPTSAASPLAAIDTVAAHLASPSSSSGTPTSHVPATPAPHQVLKFAPLADATASIITLWNEYRSAAVAESVLPVIRSLVKALQGLLAAAEAAATAQGAPFATHSNGRRVRNPEDWPAETLGAGRRFLAMLTSMRDTVVPFLTSLVTALARALGTIDGGVAADADDAAPVRIISEVWTCSAEACTQRLTSLHAQLQTQLPLA